MKIFKRSSTYLLSDSFREGLYVESYLIIDPFLFVLFMYIIIVIGFLTRWKLVAELVFFQMLFLVFSCCQSGLLFLEETKSFECKCIWRGCF